MGILVNRLRAMSNLYSFGQGSDLKGVSEITGESADKIEHLEAQLRHHGIEPMGEFICACGHRKDNHQTGDVPF